MKTLNAADRKRNAIGNIILFCLLVAVLFVIDGTSKSYDMIVKVLEKGCVYAVVVVFTGSFFEVGYDYILSRAHAVVDGFLEHRTVDLTILTQIILGDILSVQQNSAGGRLIQAKEQL